MHSNIELIIVRNPMSYSCDSTDCEILRGDDLFELVTSIYPKGQPLNTYWYSDSWNTENDVTPETAADIVALNEQGGTFYIVTYPAGPEVWIPILVSALITVASVLLMPMPVNPNAASAPPSPNNALAQRANRQRIGGRVADIYGQVWSVPDLLAVTYSVYIDHKEVEMSYFCIGRGAHLVTKALDDTTPIDQVFGSSVLVYDPNTTLNDTPAYQFGSAFTPDEAEWSRLAAKRYTSVNGQTLNAPDAYLQVKTVFKNPNIIETTDNINLGNNFRAGDFILIEGADNMQSANEVDDGAEGIVSYTLNGQYKVLAVTNKQITLSNPSAVNSDWQTLTDNTDQTTETDKVTLSTEKTALWQGYFYTDLKDHDGAYINITAPSGLYDGEPSGRWKGIRVYGAIESELVDSNSNPIAGTQHTQTFSIQSPDSERYSWRGISGGWDETTVDTSNDKLRASAAKTVRIENPYFTTGKRLRFRAARTSNVVVDESGGIVDEIKIKDFYGIRSMTASDYPKGVTTAISKTLGTEGALSLKERKLYLLAQRLERDWQADDSLIPSRRIDDIIYDIATDPVTGNLTIDDLNMVQIKAEVDAQIAYFGTDLCAQFCGTFDSKDITSEEMIQTVAMAGFFTAYRIDNKICLHFERPEAYPVATFNSHSITPDSFEYSESFGARNDYDGVEVTYTDPVDGAQITLRYPDNGTMTNPDTKDKDLIGVRNEVQARAHMMRRHWKNQHAISTCSFTAADESGIVVPTNMINVANQNRADTQQGAVEALQVNNTGQVVLALSDTVDFGSKAQGTVFVQTVAGIVDNIRCTPSDDKYEVILSRPPSQPLSTAWDAVVRATYQLVLHDDIDRDNYIVTTKEPGDNPMSHQLTCINYDPRYYKSDINPITT